jgi:hypothetical protein
MAQGVNCWPVIAEVWVQFQAYPFGIYGGQCGTAVGFPPSTSVFPHEGKSRALICFQTFMFILLATVDASYLSFQKVFFTLNNYSHSKMASP